MKRTDISKVISTQLNYNKKTFGEDLLDEFDNLEDRDLVEAFHNGAYPVGTRKNIFDLIIKRNLDLAREQITNLCRIYEFSGSKDTKSFIYFLLDYGTLDIFMKIECAHTLRQNDINDGNLYYFKILKEYRSIPYDIRPSITIYIDILRYVLIIELNTNIKENIIWTIKDSMLSSEYIYKTLISIQRDTDRKVHKTSLEYFYQQFFNLIKEPKYKILSGQYLLQNNINTNLVESELLNICNNNDVEYNTRADSADTLVRLGSNKIVILAKKIIKELGKDKKNLSTVYTNMQNVHDENIDESVKKFLLELGSVKLEQKGPNKQDLKYEDVLEVFNEYLKSVSNINIDQVNSSLLRIKLDQIVYPGSQLLSTIFIKIYTMIQKHEMKELLMQRLVDELIDMDSTCSSGHCSRLVNVFSGIDGFNMNIGFAKQIQGNIMGRIKKAINEIQDEKIQEKVMEEMIQEVPLESKPNFNKFFNQIMVSIHDELYKEYVDGKYLDKDTFENLFRGGMAFFDTGVNV